VAQARSRAYRSDRALTDATGEISLVKRSSWGPTQIVSVTVIVGCAVIFLSGGIRSGFGLFVTHIEDETGWSTAQISLGIAVQNLMWGLGQPFAGAIADRFGSGRVLAAGGVLYVLGLEWMAHASSPGEWVLSSGLVVGLALAGASLSVILSTVSRAVTPEHRPMALGLVTASSSLGQFALVPVTRQLIDHGGTHDALHTLALTALAMVVLAYGMRGRVGEGDGFRTADQSLRDALTEARRHRGFVQLTTGFFVCGFHVAFMATHLPKHIEEHGLSDNVGAWALALIGLFNIVGSLGAGYFGSRHRLGFLLTVLYAGRSLAIFVFLVMPVTTVSALLFGVAIGLMWLSTVPLTSGVVAKIFGPTHSGMLFGVVFLSHQLGGFLGVWLGGKLFDVTGSFNVVWWIAVALGVVAAVLHWSIDETPIDRSVASINGTPPVPDTRRR